MNLKSVIEWTEILFLRPASFAWMIGASMFIFVLMVREMEFTHLEHLFLAYTLLGHIGYLLLQLLSRIFKPGDVL